MAIFNNNLLAGAGAQSGTTTYEINQSIRFDDADEHFMYSPTPSSSKDFTTTATISLWFKLGNLKAGYLAGAFYGNNNRYNILAINSDGQLLEYDRVGGASTSNGTGTIGWTTTRVFRDPSAWYHAVFVWDTTNAVQSERFRLYINGVRETDFATEQALGASELVYWFGKSTPTTLGAYFTGTGYADTYYFDGYMAEMHGVDGTALDQNSFGEFNSSGIWVPKEYTGSHGTDGFYIKGADASALGTNSAANGNNFTLNGISSHDQVLDSPTNNCCVLTPLATLMGGTLSNGNLKIVLSGNDQFHSNFEISEKSYCEVRLDASSNYGGALGFGTFQGLDDDDNTIAFSMNYLSGRINLGNGSSGGDVGGNVSVGDIIMMALDPDTRKWWVGVNGTWRNSGDPAGGTGHVYQYATDYFDISSSYSTTDGIGAIVWGGFKGSANGMTVTWNFGQEGTFGGQETAGGNADGNGNGNFKYTVPSGFKALCSKSMGS